MNSSLTGYFVEIDRPTEFWIARRVSIGRNGTSTYCHIFDVYGYVGEIVWRNYGQYRKRTLRRTFIRNTVGKGVICSNSIFGIETTFKLQLKINNNSPFSDLIASWRAS